MAEKGSLGTRIYDWIHGPDYPLTKKDEKKKEKEEPTGKIDKTIDEMEGRTTPVKYEFGGFVPGIQQQMSNVGMPSSIQQQIGRAVQSQPGQVPPLDVAPRATPGTPARVATGVRRQMPGASDVMLRAIAARQAAGLPLTAAQQGFRTMAANGEVAGLPIRPQLFPTPSISTRPQSPQGPMYAEGGPVEGPSHDAGGVPIEAEGGEFVIDKEVTAFLGRKFFEDLVMHAREEMARGESESTPAEQANPWDEMAAQDDGQMIPGGMSSGRRP